MKGYILPPVQAIREALAKRLPKSRLMRSLVYHPYWYVPIEHEVKPGEAPVFRLFTDNKNQNQLFFFPDPGARSDYRSALGPKAETILGDKITVLSGREAFAAIPDSVDVVNFVGGPDASFHYHRKEPIQELKHWAKSTRVEDALAALLDDPAALPQHFKLLREFDLYWLITLPAGEESAIVGAPDTQQRKIAPIFTNSDTRDNFIDFLEKERGSLAGWKMVYLNGVSLFSQLQKNPWDGVVFNCLGPVQPRAFSRELFAQILGEAPASGSTLRLEYTPPEAPQANLQKPSIKSRGRRLSAIADSGLYLTAKELHPLDEEKSLLVLELLLFSVMLANDYSESLWAVTTNDLSLLPWRWGQSFPAFAERFERARAGLAALNGKDVKPYLEQAAKRLPPGDFREKLVAMMFALMASDGELRFQEKKLFDACCVAFGIPLTRGAEITSVVWSELLS